MQEEERRGRTRFFVSGEDIRGGWREEEKEERLAATRWWWLGAEDQSSSKSSPVELATRDRGFSLARLSPLPASPSVPSARLVLDRSNQFTSPLLPSPLAKFVDKEITSDANRIRLFLVARPLKASPLYEGGACGRLWVHHIHTNSNPQNRT